MHHKGIVRSLAFNPDGSMLAVAAENAVHVWHIPRSLNEPAEQLLLWIETIAAATVDDAGLVTRLDSDHLSKKLDDLGRAGGPPKSYLEELARRRAAMPRPPSPPEPD
jgi:hypothetical protein